MKSNVRAHVAQVQFLYRRSLDGVCLLEVTQWSVIVIIFTFQTGGEV